MIQPLAYRLSHSTGTVDLALTGDRFVVATRGNGLADKPRTIDVAVSDLRHFCLTPTTAVQNTSGTRANRVIDTARDAELIFSWVDAGRLKKKRVFVAASDPALVALVSTLQMLRPDASLLDLPPRDAYAKIGVLSPQQGVLIVLAVLIGLPMLAVLVWLAIRALS